MVNDVPENSDFVHGWIQCLAGAVDCGVHIVLRIHFKSLDKSCYFRPA
jgi:hypothetical protein